MKVLTIDWGSYSAKFFYSSADKKQIFHNQVEELVFDKKIYDNQEQQWDSQLDDINRYLKNHLDFEGKIILSPPNELLSFRFKQLPVAQKKKAQAMLPFQLEDEIPFTLQDTYLASTLIKNKKSFSALCFFAKRTVYQKCIDLLAAKKLPINSLTHIIDPLFLSSTELPMLKEGVATCLLDIGHETTKAYFFNGKNLQGFQLSHFGGSRIDEMMSSVYRLSTDQLKKFKHESAFIVPRELFSASKLTDDQKFFAENMDMLFYGFVQEFRRWEMSFRVETKEKISNIYIVGGTSLIKNIDQYLSYYWECPVQKLTSLTDSFNKISHISKSYANFAMGDFLSQTHRFPNKTTNHLGSLSLGTNIEPLPLYAIGFLGARVAFFSLLSILLGFLYLTLLSQSESEMDKTLKLVTQNPQLEFSAVEKSQILLTPDLGVKKVDFKIKTLKSDLKRISELNSVNALKPLRGIQTALSGTSCIISNYESDQNHKGRFSLVECNDEQSKKFMSSLSLQGPNYKIKQSSNNSVDGTF